MKPAGIEKQKKTTRIRPRVDGSLFFFSSIPRIRPQKAWLRVLLLFPRPSLWAGLGSARLFSLTVFGSCFFFVCFSCFTVLIVRRRQRGPAGTTASHYSPPHFPNMSLLREVNWITPKIDGVHTTRAIRYVSRQVASFSGKRVWTSEPVRTFGWVHFPK